MQCPHCGFDSNVPRALRGQPVICPNCAGQFIVPADTFDPYYTWLGIPPAHQPPNSYRLLGLQLFEPNSDVIENAADRQMLHVRSYQLGAHAADSQRLLNEIASARVTLLDLLQKEAYDEQLHGMLAPAVPAPHYQSAYAPAVAVAAVAHSTVAPPRTISPPEPPPAPPPQRPFDAAPSSQTLVDSAIHRRSSVRPGKSESSGMLTPFMIIAGAIIGLTIGALAIFYITGQDYLGFSAKLRQNFDEGQERGAPNTKPQSLQVPKNAPRASSPKPPQPDGRRRAADSGQGSGAPPTPIPQPAPTPTIVLPRPVSFPKAVALPDPASRDPVVLAQIPGDVADPIEFSLRSEFTALPSNAQLVGAPNEESGEFTINYVPPDEIIPLPLAGFRREGSNLVFRWVESPVDPAVRRQVRNCVVDIAIGGESHRLQLREPRAVARLVLDLEDGNQDFDLDVDDTPKLANIRLKIRSLDQFTQGAKLRGSASLLEAAKPVFIEFTEMKGPLIELRLLQQPRTKALHVRLEPVFHESVAREFELTLASLKKSEAAQQKVVREGRSAQVTEAKARLAKIPEIRNFINSLHNRASIHYSLSAIDGDHELVLAGNAIGD